MPLQDVTTDSDYMRGDSNSIYSRTLISYYCLSVS